MAVVDLLRRVPAWGWRTLSASVIALALWIGHEREVTQAYAQGKRDAAAGVVFDSLLSQRAAEVVAIRSAHTDTVTRKVRTTRKRVDAMIAALPDSVRVIPAVDSLLGVVRTLTVEVDALVSAHTAERAAWTEHAKVDAAAIYSLRIIATNQADTIATLKRRPHWRTVALGSVVGAAAGMLAGVVLR
jgi:hypothetical protein